MPLIETDDPTTPFTGAAVEDASPMDPPSIGEVTAGDDSSSTSDTTTNAQLRPDGKTEDQVQFLKSVIRSSYFVGELPDEPLDALISSFERIEYQPGQAIFQEGADQADYMYILHTGLCTVSLGGQRLPAPYGTIAPGSVIGEMALMYDASRRERTVRAQRKSVVYRLHKDRLDYFANLHGQNTINNNNSPQDMKEDLTKDLAKIDQVFDEVSGIKTRYGGEVIRTFRPDRRWLWQQWTGTILQHAWKTSVINMVITAIFLLVLQHGHGELSWGVGMLPQRDHPWIARLVGLHKLFGYLMTLTTFTLTFFLNQAYDLWKDIYQTARIVQGKLNDIHLILVISVARNRNGSYSPKAKVLLEDVASCTRLFHIFMWASCSEKLKVLQTDRAMHRMIGRGILTRKQYTVIRQ